MYIGFLRQSRNRWYKQTHRRGGAGRGEGGVDDLGSDLVAWDNGSGLNAVLDEDVVEIIE